MAVAAMASIPGGLPLSCPVRAAQMEPGPAYRAAYDAGDFRTATALARVALDQCRATRKPPFTDCFTLWSEVLDSGLSSQNDEMVEQEALAFLRAAQMADGPDSPTVADAISTLSSLYRRQGRLEESAAYRARDVALTRKLLGPDHPDLAISLGNEGVLLDAMGRYEEAEMRYRPAIAIAAKAGKASAPLYATQRNNLARNLDNQGRLEESAAESAQVLALYATLYPASHPQQAIARNNRAIVLRQLGQLDEAETLAREAYAIHLARLGPDNRETLAAQLTLARLLATIGRDQAAQALMVANIAQRRGPMHRPELPNSLIVYADFLVDRQRGSDAIALLREAIVVESSAQMPRSLVLGRARDALARALQQSGLLDEAEAEARASLALTQGRDGNPMVRLDGQTTLAGILVARGRQEDAIALYRASMREAERLLAPGHAQRLDLRIALGAALARQDGSQAEALAVLDAGADEAQARATIDALASSEGAGGSGRLGALGAARVAVITALRASGTMSGPEADRRSFMAAQDAQRSGAVRAGEMARAERGSADAALADIERTRFMLARRIVNDEKRLGDRLRQNADGEAAKALAGALAQTRARFAELTQQVQADYPRYVAALSPDRLDPARVQTMLGVREAVLLAVPGVQGYGLWLVTHKALQWHGTAAIEADIDRVLLSLKAAAPAMPRGQVGTADGGSYAFDSAAADRLGQAILGGFAPALRGIDHIRIVVGGPLARLPLALLRWRGQWLADAMKTSRLPAVASLNARAGKPIYVRRTGAQIVALGAVPARAQWPGLPGAQGQLEDLRQLFGTHATIRAGHDATVEWATQGAHLDNADMIVFATHSRQTPAPAAEFALHMAPGAGRADDDGMLSLSQIGALRLRQPLVVLTACDTAGMSADDADPLASFARSFFLAGARALVVSHWALDDAAGRVQMLHFFRLLRDRPAMDVGQALRRSALSLRDDPSGRWRHPRYWAALSFVDGGG